MKHICGIDPGMNGGIVLLAIEDDLIWIVNKFIFNKKPSGELDIDSLCSIINELNERFSPLFVLEETHAIFGAGKGSMFKMGRVLGTIEASLACNNCRYQLIKPKSWQSKVWLPEDIVYKNGKVKDTKATSLKSFKRLSIVDLFYGDNEKNVGRRSKLHDGLVDAFLIAYSQI